MSNAKDKSMPKMWFIEAMLKQHGWIKRSNLQRAFQFEAATATRYINEFRAKFPEAMFLDPSTKTYFARSGFTPALLTVEPQVYLDAAQLMTTEPIIQTKTTMV